MSIHGHPVGLRRRGTGEKVLLIHGLAGSSKTWDGVIPLLTPHLDVIAVDLLGHGESAKPMGDYSLGAFASGLRDFLSILGIDGVTIVGYSFGGGVAMQLAYQHPHLVDRATDVGRKLGRRNIRSPKLAEMWRAYSSLAGATNRKAFVRTMRGVIEPTGQTVNATDRLYLAAHAPTMIVWGEDDGIIPIEHAYAAHELIPASRLEIIEGAGHFVHVEQPDTFADLLIDFIESTEPASMRLEALRDALLKGS